MPLTVFKASNSSSSERETNSSSLREPELTDAELDPNIKSIYCGMEDTCLGVSCRWGFYDIVKILLECRRINPENIIEVLLSLRVNALQISPELRKNLVYEGNVFNIIYILEDIL